jgi:transaldolase/glucose-6-phosphate isomerase
MIKVPGTPEGIAAVEELIGEGINVNVTLLFSQEVYEQAARAYIRGLSALASRGGDVRKIAGVASFFVSRIDTLADRLISEKLPGASGTPQEAVLRGLLGKVAIANAKLAYARYLKIFESPEWKALEGKGAHTQRVLWASTSSKNPAYRDVMYVEELIGPDTVNTLPPATLDAFRDHGQVRLSLTEGLKEAHDTMETLNRVGISMRDVTEKLLDEGLHLFSESFHKLLEAVEKTHVTPAGV